MAMASWRRRGWRRCGALAAGWLWALSVAHAAPFPSQTVRLIVPYPAGGSNDVLARLLAPKLAEIWNQSVIVENRTGASGIVGTEAVANAVGDGHTLLIGANSSITIAPHLRTKMAFDPAKDLAPITNIASLPAALVVNPRLPAKTVGELVGLLKQSPDKFDYASSGTSSTAFLNAQLFQMLTGTTMQHIPYNGLAPAELALIAGDVQVFFDSATTALPFIRDGRMRILGVASMEPWPLAPDFPLIASALAGFESATFIGVFAPGTTPADLRQRLADDLRKVINDPPMRQRLVELGAVPSSIGMTTADFQSYLRNDSEKWGGVIAKVGLKQD